MPPRTRCNLESIRRVDVAIVAYRAAPEIRASCHYDRCAPSKEVVFVRVSHHKRDLDDGSLDNLLREGRGSCVSAENISSEVPLCGCVTALTNGSCCVKAGNAVAIGHRQEKRDFAGLNLRLLNSICRHLFKLQAALEKYF